MRSRTGSMPGSCNQPAQVLIAHQSAIPSYRVRFYELLEQVRPASWEFKVVVDRESPVDGHAAPTAEWNFPVFHKPIYQFNLPALGPLKWQNFIRQARQADAIVLDTTIRNLGYPIAAFCRRRKAKLIFWGHTTNLNIDGKGNVAAIADSIKRRYVTTCDSFFSYTQKQATDARELGLYPGSIVTLNNTVDIAAHRQRYLDNAFKRTRLREAFGFGTNTKVLLVVGRLIKQRRIDFLLETFRQLPASDDWRLIIIGDGPESITVGDFVARFPSQKIITPGAISDEFTLSDYYLAADAFVLPGMVGLAPLEAICYNLPVIAFDLATHSPEIDYLTAQNSTILPATTSPKDFADYLIASITPLDNLERTDNAYNSISHLTLESMVSTFAEGITKALSQ